MTVAALMLGLVLIGALWIGSAVAVAAASGQASGIVVGCAFGDALLFNALIFPDGQVMAQRFNQNLTTRRGPYVGLARGRHYIDDWRSRLTPRMGADQVSRYAIFNLALPALALLIALGLLVIPRFLRQRHRRRLGLCLACGYDLRGAPSSVCPECGTLIAVRTAQRAPAAPTSPG